MTFARCLALAGIAVLTSAPSLAAPIQPETIPLTCVRQDHEFTLAQAPGRTIAVHFVPHPEHPECTAFVREYFQRWPAAAGVYHVFVVNAEPSAIKEWASQFEDESLMIAADTGGRLATELKVPGAGKSDAAPATVVLGPDGREFFRRIGAGPHDNMSFADFARMLEQKTIAPALNHYNLPKGKPVAVEGYDVVTYFTPGKTVKGKPDLSSRYRGVTYHFSTAENRRLFARDPEKYLPTYGGWCASAMGDKGAKVEIAPTNFKVKDGRLFLFYKSVFADALKDWNKHEREWEPAADANWKKLTDEDPIKPTK